MQNASVVTGSDNDIKNSITEGVNTIRLHHQAVLARKLKKQQQLLAKEDDGATEIDSSIPQYIENSENDYEHSIVGDDATGTRDLQLEEQNEAAD